jgi:hypothetical protein
VTICIVFKNNDLQVEAGIYARGVAAASCVYTSLAISNHHARRKSGDVICSAGVFFSNLQNTRTALRFFEFISGIFVSWLYLWFAAVVHC